LTETQGAGRFSNTKISLGNLFCIFAAARDVERDTEDGTGCIATPTSRKQTVSALSGADKFRFGLATTIRIAPSACFLGFGIRFRPTPGVTSGTEKFNRRFQSGDAN